MGGNYGIVALFLEKGADIHTKATGESGYTSLHFAVGKNCCPDIVKLLLHYGAKVNTKDALGKTPLSLALEHSYSKIIDLFLADPNINVGCIHIGSLKNGENKEKIRQKFAQDYKLFNLIKKAADNKDLDKLLQEIKESLESKTKHGFKPSLNYSPDGSDENTTVEIAIKAGGKLLDLLYDYAEKNISKDTEIFKRLKTCCKREGMVLK